MSFCFLTWKLCGLFFIVFGRMKCPTVSCSSEELLLIRTIAEPPSRETHGWRAIVMKLSEFVKLSNRERETLEMCVSLNLSRKSMPYQDKSIRDETSQRKNSPMNSLPRPSPSVPSSVLKSEEPSALEEVHHHRILHLSERTTSTS